MTLPAKPNELCWRCKAPLEYRWDTLVPGGMWVEEPCKWCEEQRRETSALLKQMEAQGLLERTAMDRNLEPEEDPVAKESL